MRCSICASHCRLSSNGGSRPLSVIIRRLSICRAVGPCVVRCPPSRLVAHPAPAASANTERRQKITAPAVGLTASVVDNRALQRITRVSIADRGFERTLLSVPHWGVSGGAWLPRCRENLDQ